MKSKFLVSREEAGMTLLAFLRKKMVETSSSVKAIASVKQIKKAIDQKCCTINRRTECFSTHRLKEGDCVEWDHCAPSGEITVLYEDEFLLVCNKPSGVICEDRHFRFQKSLFLVHRLDKETSGCLILAKSKGVKEKMIPLFEEKKVRKLYLALVDGIVKKDQGRIDNHLGKIHSYQGQTVYGKSARGKRAITEWKCVKRGAQASLLVCEPLTGRTHQLRAHLAEMGHPILGDVQYAGRFRSSLRPRRHLLHAWRLRFPHPVKEEEVCVEAPLPNDFTMSLSDACG